MKRNPQAWLPIGQRIVINNSAIPTPSHYDSNGVKSRCYYGTIVEHLAHGSVVVKFVGYERTWDYAASEAVYFSKV